MSDYSFKDYGKAIITPNANSGEIKTVVNLARSRLLFANWHGIMIGLVPETPVDKRHQVTKILKYRSYLFFPGV